MADISLEEETLKIYRDEVEKLIQNDPKYNNLGSDELEAVIKAFEYIMQHGKKNVRAEMLYEMVDIDKKD